jgi:hypothetical protein
MDFKFLTESVKNIIADPSKAWDIINSENRNGKYINISLILPLILLASVSALLGSFFFINTGLTDAYSVLAGFKYFILYYLVIYGTALILAELTKVIDLDRDKNLTFKLVAYSSIPFLLCQVVSRLFESFLFINVLALFGLYVFWVGMEKMMNPPEQRKATLLIAAAIIFVVLFYTADWILSGLFDKLYFTFFA